MMSMYLPLSLLRGRKVAANPWPATGLEWEKASSPPVTENFEAPPEVTWEAYPYAEKDAAFYRQPAFEETPREHPHA